MEDIKFSVLVPVYNAEKYLDECIKSVLEQTYQNYELILVDDGSTDLSGATCDKYCAENNKVKVIHKKNQGLILARRDGLKLSSGDYIMFLDSDDCYRQDTLELICKNIIKHKADLVLFNVSKEEGFKRKDWDFGFSNEQEFFGKQKEILYEKIITTSVLNNLCFKAVKRELIDIDKDYSEFSFVTSAEDLLQSLPIIDNANRVLYLDETLYFYRQHGSSMVHNFNIKSYNSIKTVYKVLMQYVEKWQKNDLLCKHCSLRMHTVLNYSRSIVLNSKDKKKTKKQELYNLSKDEFFINAFLTCDKSVLNKKDLFLINLLYKGKINRFCRYTVLRNRISKIISLIR